MVLIAEAGSLPLLLSFGQAGFTDILHVDAVADGGIAVVRRAVVVSVRRIGQLDGKRMLARAELGHRFPVGKEKIGIRAVNATRFDDQSIP